MKLFARTEELSDKYTIFMYQTFFIVSIAEILLSI